MLAFVRRVDPTALHLDAGSNMIFPVALEIAMFKSIIPRVAVVAGALFVAACSGQSNSIPGSGANGPTSATQALRSQPESLLTGGAPAQTQETVLHNFAGGSDGVAPISNLLDVKGVLYGVTAQGGTMDYGTVFKITTAGVETVLHSFKGGSDGISPSGLTEVNGMLYGTTLYGGDAHQDGIVFAMTTSGQETVLHTFDGTNDGENPAASLTNVNGVLYGTTYSNARDFDGTVYKITTSGVETVLHSFSGSDGAAPLAALTYANGVLYGTTSQGGANGLGTVFEITTSGAESTLHSFSGTDGANPYAGLTDVDGVFYGTTGYGGRTGRFGGGTVFKITASGTEKVLHSFEGGDDGRIPDAGLINVNGVLYGTTALGGNDPPNGTVFKITTSGIKTTLYHFERAKSSFGPGGLTYLNGMLYGTNESNGTDNDGTVFSLSL